MTRVAIQGVAGSYSEEAAQRLLGSDASIVECRDFQSTFDAIVSGLAEAAVVPVENKIVGRIDQSSDLLTASGYRVVERLSLRVQHVVAGAPGAKFDDVTSVRSHVEALKQCQRFLADHPRMKQVIGADTASSIRRVVEDGDLTKAAIGSRRAALLYGATILAEGIADDPDNWTTFYLIAN